MKKNNEVLQDLLKKCDKDAPMPDELVEWDKVKPIGKELESEVAQQSQEEMEDKELAQIVEDRKNKPEIEVDFADL